MGFKERGGEKGGRSLNHRCELLVHKIHMVTHLGEKGISGTEFSSLILNP